MLILFLEEVSRIRATSPTNFFEPDEELDSFLGQLLSVRERIFSNNKTLVLDRSQSAPSPLADEEWVCLTETRHRIRERFLNAVDEFRSNSTL
jgi:hypothetical protein